MPQTGSGRSAAFVPTFADAAKPKSRRVGPAHAVATRTRAGAIASRRSPSRLASVGRRAARSRSAAARGDAAPTKARRLPKPILIGGLVALVAAGALGVFLASNTTKPLADDPPTAERPLADAAPDNGADSGRADGDAADGPSQPAVTFAWPEGEFPPLSNEAAVRRTLQVTAAAPILQLSVNGEVVNWREPSRILGFHAAILTPDGEPLLSELNHRELHIEMEIRSGQGTDRFAVEVELADGSTHRTTFAARIDRDPPTIRFDRPGVTRRVDVYDLQSAFRMNTRDVTVGVTVRDAALERVRINRSWSDEPIDVPIAERDIAVFRGDIAFPDDGHFRLEIEAHDLAGNSARLSQEFIIDTKPPTVRIDGLDADQFAWRVERETITIRGVVEDEEGVRELRRNDIPISDLAGEVGERRRTFELRSVPLRLGENVVELVAIDLAGNQRPVTLRVTFEDPSLPRLMELRIDGEIVWSDGNEATVLRYLTTSSRPVEVMAYVRDQTRPRVSINGHDAELREEDGARSEFVFAHRVPLETATDLTIQLEGEGGDPRTSRFVILTSDLPLGLVGLTTSTDIDLLGTLPPSTAETSRAAAAFTVSADGARILTVTREESPRLIAYDISGDEQAQIALPLTAPAADVQESAVGLAVVAGRDGSLVVAEADGRAAARLPVRVAPESAWHLDDRGRLVGQRSDGAVFVYDITARKAVNLASAGDDPGTVRLPGAPDGPVLTVAGGRYALVGRGDSLFVISLAHGLVAAELPLRARRLLAGEPGSSRWYVVDAEGALRPFDGLTERAEGPLVAANVIDVARLADGRLAVLAGGAAEDRSLWHLVSERSGETLRSFELPDMKDPRTAAASNRLWTLHDGFVVHMQVS